MKDGRTITDDWWASLSPEEKDYYAKDMDDKEKYWAGVPMPERWIMYDKYHAEPVVRRVEQKMPEFEAPLPTPSVQNEAPRPVKPFEVKPIMPTAPPEIDPEQEKLGKSLGNQIQRPKMVNTAPKPRLEPPVQTTAPGDVPDFDSMKMAKLRKYAKDKQIKTGGRKMADIRKDLYKAYS